MGVAAIAAAAIDGDHISRVDAARFFCRKNQHAMYFGSGTRGYDYSSTKAGRSEVDDGSREGYECSVNFPLTGIRGIACAGPAWGVSRLSLSRSASAMLPRGLGLLRL